ncbi:LacI family DNA-binding transcriptional regulator [Celeribacter litoreus]|uniref:LacI family DNA-binding transcriptional regulator n=1 Tax=Celeribacter litoreus TaxID=2876714 RepID=UPI001CCB7540|nr:LacI family DNA-binding transcriptional regulator [Celeribacter litoreus]MCA0043193.1 LacI family transcriptional regulator [Celeribacter litoreus]
MSDIKIRNMDEFAAVSGLSRPTVSKYFNDPESVRPRTRERIEAALERYDYTPNFFAVNQNRNVTKNIGIVVPNLSDPFFAEVSRGIGDLVAEAGYRPVLLGSRGDPEQEIDNLENLRLIKPAGVLMAPLGRVSDVEKLKKFCEDVPTVLFDSNIDGVGEAFVGSNNHTSIALIVEYLCRTGEPPCFFEMRTPANPNAHKRRAAYIETMERLGHKPHVLQAEGEGWDFEAIGFEAASELFAGRKLPTNTILCSNDRLAIGVLSAAYQAGLRVGHGAGCALRIAGHDDHPFSRYTCPTLTTVSQDYAAISENSVQRLLAMIESGIRPTAREVMYLDGRLEMRGSA